MNRAQPLQYDPNHYRILYNCLSLFVVLYLPETGFDDAPVGEELMEWLNTHFIEPSSEEGDHLSSQDRPWQDEIFWPYLARYLPSFGREAVLNLHWTDQSCEDSQKHLSFCWKLYLAIPQSIYKT